MTSFDVSVSGLALVVFAFVLSLVVGHIVVVQGLRVLLSSKSKPHPRAWGVGLIERIIYTSSILMGLPSELIGGWLVLKGLAQFKPGKDATNSTEEFMDDYYAHLIGTGLSLIIGIGSGLLGRYLLGLDMPT